MWEWHHTGFGGEFMWVFWLLIIFVVVLLIKANSNENDSNERGESPLEILENRYVRGEIDEREFRLRQKELSG